MDGVYDLKLVVLSIVVAAIASYTALDLAGRVSTKRGWSSWLWLSGGAVSMGIGIWSMHFIAMLAFKLLVPVAYDLPITLLSMLAGILVSGLALFMVRRPSLTHRDIATGAALMGVGIATMHYTGMAAMRMSPPIQYDPTFFLASVVVAVGASMAALWVAFQLRHKYSGTAILAKLGSASVMGFAIAGMHYTGMAATQFAPDSVCLAADSAGMEQATLAAIIGGVTVGILALTLVLSAFDAHYAARTAKLADSLQAANEQLRNVALHDRLTGLANRMLLEDRLEQAVFRAKRAGGSFAVLFVDLDRFKPVNDTFGHAVGDELLKAVADRLAGCVRRADTVARPGGDEFVVALGDATNGEGAAKVAGKILDELRRPFHVQGHALEISCSIGASVYPDNGRDVQTLMLNADKAMYQAKRAGRNKLEFLSPEAGGAPQGALR